MRVCLFFCLLLAMPLAQADIYKSYDAEGHVSYSNLPSPGARRLDLGPILQTNDQPVNMPAGRKVTPANFPKVTPAAQKKMDDTRHQILQKEYDREEEALTEAKKALEEGKAVRYGNERNYARYLERIKGLQDAVTAHEKNLDAIRQEMDRH